MGVFLASKPMRGNFILTDLLPSRARDENSSVILWVMMCDCQKFLTKLVK